MPMLLPRYNEYGDLFGSLGSGLANVLQTVQSHKANQKLESLLANASPVLNEFAETGQYNPALLELLGAAASPGIAPERAQMVQGLVQQGLQGARAKKSVGAPGLEVESLLSALPETLELDEINQEQARLRQAMPALNDTPSRLAVQKQYTALENRKKELMKPDPIQQIAQEEAVKIRAQDVEKKAIEAASSSGSLRSVENTAKLIKNSPPVNWTLRKLADKVGVPQLVGEAGQILQADFKKYLQEGQKIFGGRLTDRDVGILEGIVPQIGNTKVANLAIVNLQAAKDWEAVEQNKIRRRLIKEMGYSDDIEELVQEEMANKTNPYLERMRAYAEMATLKVNYDDYAKKGLIPVLNENGELGSFGKGDLDESQKSQLEEEGWIFL